MSESATRHGPSRDQLIVLACLTLIAALAWVYLAGLAAGPPMRMEASTSGMPTGGASPAATPDARLFALTALMWAVMMVGMMLPSAAPMILIHAGAQRRRSMAARLARSGLFVAGYLVVWLGFSLAATAAQLWLARLAWLSPTMALASGPAAGAVLAGVGFYELTAVKRTCLEECRGPVAFIAEHWRPGARGALEMGVEHGLYCLGCCWALMLALFAGGVMNLGWVAALAAVVLAQKLLPVGRAASYLTALAFIVGGVVLAIGLP